MLNLSLSIILFLHLSCDKKEEVLPISEPQPAAPLEICITCPVTDTLTFGYTVTESVSGYSTEGGRNTVVATASPCFQESHFVIKNSEGKDILCYTFVESPSFVASYNKNTVHALTYRSGWWFTSDPWFKNSSVYFMKDPQNITNASFKVNCLTYIRTDCNNYSYYYANISLVWTEGSKKYSAEIKTVITIQ